MNPILAKFVAALMLLLVLGTVWYGGQFLYQKVKRIGALKSLDYFLRGTVAVAFFLFIANGDWIDAVSTAFIFILMTAPLVLKQWYKTSTPLELDIALSIFVYLTLYLGSANDYYEHYPWFDVALHFLSGILLGMVGFTLVYMLNESESKKLRLSPGFVAFFAVTFSMAVSVVWELFEYSGDLMFGYNMQESGLPDTMGDFTVNAIGALIVAFIGYLWMRKRKRIPFIQEV
jgi:hypothetical protein